MTRSVVRVIGLGLAIVPLFLGFVPVLIDARRRGLHDFLAGTVVLYAGSRVRPGAASGPGARGRKDLGPMTPDSPARVVRSGRRTYRRGLATKEHLDANAADRLAAGGEAAREELLVKEKEQTRARDALAAERRRMPWMAVEKEYRFEGPDGAASLDDLFEGRRQLVIYRAFYAPDVTTLRRAAVPERACSAAR